MQALLCVFAPLRENFFACLAQIFLKPAVNLNTSGRRVNSLLARLIARDSFNESFGDAGSSAGVALAGHPN
jgi:hypothetical protein